MEFYMKYVLKAAVVCWLCATVIVSGASGMVLCIGENGHFALEPAHSGRCQGRDEAASHRGQPAAARLTLENTDNGDCVDVSLSSDNMSHLTKKLRRSRLLKSKPYRTLATAFTTPPDTAVGSVAPTARCAAPPRPPPSLLAQRTIVLRI